MVQRARSEQPRERRAVPFAAVLAFGVATFLAALMGAWLVYRELIRYEPRAARHLLPGTEIAARLDVEQVVVFEPVRRHLLPLADTPLITDPEAANATSALAGAPAPERLRALRELADLQLGRDLREIVVARTAAGAWMLALGGLFPKRGLTAAIEEVLRREGVQTLERLGDVLVLAPGGMALAQAPDGVLVIASSREAVESALPQSELYAQIGMPAEGDGSLVVTSEPIRRWRQQVQSVFDLPASNGLVVSFRIERPLRLEATLGGHDAGTLAPALASAQRSLSFDSRPPAAFPITDWGAERALLARASVVPGEDNRPKIVTFMELPELDAALAWLAARAQRSLHPAARGG